MTAYKIVLATLAVATFENKHAAESTGNDGVIVSSEEDMLNNVNLTGPVLVSLHNSMADKPVAKFSDRKAAARRTWALLVEKNGAWVEGKGTPLPDTATEELVAKSKKGKKAAAAKKARGAKGNRDKALYPTEGHAPYRDNTQSGATWKMITANPGKTFAEYIAMGGRANTINHAIRNQYLTFDKPA